MTATRHHDAGLEQGVLDAAWDELVASGYAMFTMDAVAARAGISRYELHCNWSGKRELILAAVTQAVNYGQGTVPDTGTLRGDTIALMHLANKRVQLAIVMTVHLDGYYEETGTTPADLRQALVANRPRVPRVVLDRAIARGEIVDRRVSDRVAMLPYMLLQEEFLFTLKPAPAEVIELIVDSIFLPLVS